MNRLRHKLIAATKRIEGDYFYLPVAGSDPVYRERVYCYELYHQLRCLWGDFPFKLCGEVDKSSHPHFGEGPYAKAKPDLLVHRPGLMENLSAIEVKSCNGTENKFKHDLEKLTWFCREAKYLCGVFLVYGITNGGADAIREKVLRAAKLSNNVDMQFIECFYHAEAGYSASKMHV